MSTLIRRKPLNWGFRLEATGAGKQLATKAALVNLHSPPVVSQSLTDTQARNCRSLRESIRRYQKSAELLIRAAPPQRLVREIAQDLQD